MLLEEVNKRLCCYNRSLKGYIVIRGYIVRIVTKKLCYYKRSIRGYVVIIDH